MTNPCAEQDLTIIIGSLEELQATLTTLYLGVSELYVGFDDLGSTIGNVGVPGEDSVIVGGPTNPYVTVTRLFTDWVKRRTFPCSRFAIKRIPSTTGRRHRLFPDYDNDQLHRMYCEMSGADQGRVDEIAGFLGAQRPPDSPDPKMDAIRHFIRHEFT